jgi:glucose-6-phosphate-specific signal transduction histidine kinase
MICRSRDETTRRIVVVLLLATLYALSFVPLHGVIDRSAAIISAVPVVVASWFFGTRTGVLAGLLTLPVNTILIGVAGGDQVDFLRAGGVLGSITTVAVWSIVGRLRELGIRAVRAEARGEVQFRELQQLSERLVNSQEDERKRMARRSTTVPFRQPCTSSTALPRRGRKSS